MKLEIISNIDEKHLLFGMNYIEYRITRGERVAKGVVSVTGLYRAKAVIAVLESIAKTLAELSSDDIAQETSKRIDLR